MNTVKELQNSLSQLIYSITDIEYLSKIKSTVEGLVNSTAIDRIDKSLPWQKAELSMKSISSFEKEVICQGNKKLMFEDLYPYIDESSANYSLEDLLAALK